MSDSWPNQVEYSDAIQSPSHCFQDPGLRAGETVVDALGLPVPCAGGFAVVYQVRSADRQKTWAVKCFKKSVPGLKERYREISRHLAQAQLPLAVEFKYLEEGILIRGAWYPVLKMDWVAGLTLRQFVQDNLEQPRLLEALFRVWLKVEPLLARAGAAHGDLQHGNVLLVPGKRQDAVTPRLIDYDGMWVPALAGHPPPEAGHPAYQHPKRAERNVYTADVDRFPHLVVACALRCLAGGEAPELWRAYDDGDNLLFKNEDFQSPGKSDLLRWIWTSGNEELRAWAGHLVIAADSPLEATPPLSRLLVDGKLPPLSPSEESQAGRILDETPQFIIPRPSAAWPGRDEYLDAVQDPFLCFSDPDLRAARTVVDALGLPAPCTGAFADVYQLRSADGKKAWAVKCFSRSIPGLKERYREISQHLEQARLPLTVGFKLIEEGIRAGKQWYPVLKMDWVEGLNLREFVLDNLQRPEKLEDLFQIWLKVEPLLVSARVAHGDLQHANVLLVPGKHHDAVSLRLIDYDGMWVPALAAQSPLELGHPAYRHPQRAVQNTHSADADRFAHLVIACALKCLARSDGTELWQRYDDGDNLLFTAEDFQSPATSDLLKRLWQSDDEELQDWAGHVAIAADSPLEATPRLCQLLIEGTLPPLAGVGKWQARRILGDQPATLVPRPALLPPATIVLGPPPGLVARIDAIPAPLQIDEILPRLSASAESPDLPVPEQPALVTGSDPQPGQPILDAAAAAPVGAGPPKVPVALPRERILRRASVIVTQAKALYCGIVAMWRRIWKQIQSACFRFGQRGRDSFVRLCRAAVAACRRSRIFGRYVWGALSRRGRDLFERIVAAGLSRQSVNGKRFPTFERAGERIRRFLILLWPVLTALLRVLTASFRALLAPPAYYFRLWMNLPKSWSQMGYVESLYQNRELRFASAVYLVSESGWEITLPMACIVCGRPCAGPEHTIEQVVTDPRGLRRAMVVGAGGGLVLWFYLRPCYVPFLAALIGVRVPIPFSLFIGLSILAALSIAYCRRVEHLVNLRLHRCAEHMADTRFPEMLLVRDSQTYHSRAELNQPASRPTAVNWVLVIRAGHARFKTFVEDQRLTAIEDAKPEIREAAPQAMQQNGHSPSSVPPDSVAYRHQREATQ